MHKWANNYSYCYSSFCLTVHSEMCSSTGVFHPWPLRESCPCSWCGRRRKAPPHSGTPTSRRCHPHSAHRCTSQDKSWQGFHQMSIGNPTLNRQEFKIFLKISGISWENTVLIMTFLHMKNSAGRGVLWIPVLCMWRRWSRHTYQQQAEKQMWH